MGESDAEEDAFDAEAAVDASFQKNRSAAHSTHRASMSRSLGSTDVLARAMAPAGEPSFGKRPSVGGSASFIKAASAAITELSSETQDQLEAESLLRDARERSPFLKALDSGDLASLAQAVSIVGFDAGEQVMMKGQTATWVGIVLSGELAATVGDSVVGRMSAGKIVGELAFFAGGQRHADVKGSTAGFIAFIMTQHLLQLFRDSPGTGAKLVRAFGAYDTGSHSGSAERAMQASSYNVQVDDGRT